MKKSSLFVALCCVVTVVMLTQCVCGEKKPSPARTVSARGIISDRNGLVLVSNDTSYVTDSAGLSLSGTIQILWQLSFLAMSNMQHRQT